jgi:hypothetical protein
MKKAGVRKPRHCPRRQLQEMLYGTPTSTSRIVREFRGEYPAVLRLQALALSHEVSDEVEESKDPLIIINVSTLFHHYYS